MNNFPPTLTTISPFTICLVKAGQCRGLAAQTHKQVLLLFSLWLGKASLSLQHSSQQENKRRHLAAWARFDGQEESSSSWQWDQAAGGWRVYANLGAGGEIVQGFFALLSSLKHVDLVPVSIVYSLYDSCPHCCCRNAGSGLPSAKLPRDRSSSSHCWLQRC